MVKLLSKISTSPADGSIDVGNDPKMHEFFLSRGITVKNNQVEKNSSNKISLGVAAVGCGADVLEVCRLLSWKDFEIFSSEILKFHNYFVYVNYRIKNPRRQVDIIGVRSKIALIVDCKHWKHTSFSALREVVEKQKERSDLLGGRQQPLGIKKLYPIIVTFLQGEFHYINDVPIVPIQNFNSFLLDFDNHNHDFFYTIA